MDNIPEFRAGQILLRFHHPDYASNQGWGGLQREQDVAVASLRQQKATIIMHRGIAVTGTVTDPQGKPIAGAVVAWGDDPYLEAAGSGQPQQVLRDAHGVYRLPPLSSGQIAVTVMAEGWSPDMKKIALAPENPKVDFRLASGKTMRFRFVDDDGKPIPKVSVRLDGWRGLKSLYNEKLAFYVLDTKIPDHADAHGIYQWTWAPGDRVHYLFWKAGYEGDHFNVLAADGKEHEVRLTRQVPDSNRTGAGK
jgi:hypothetical protein